MKTITVTKENFHETVGNNERTVIDFWASWCGPCRMLGPVLDEVAAETADQAVIGKVNVDEQPDLASRFNVMSIPTMVFFNNGEEIDRLVGVAPKKSILEKLQLN
jgi:thioredoxin 1